MLAAAAGNRQSVAALLTAGADLTLTDQWGSTALRTLSCTHSRTHAHSLTHTQNHKHTLHSNLTPLQKLRKVMGKLSSPQLCARSPQASLSPPSLILSTHILLKNPQFLQLLAPPLRRVPVGYLAN